MTNTFIPGFPWKGVDASLTFIPDAAADDDWDEKVTEGLDWSPEAPIHRDSSPSTRGGIRDRATAAELRT